ncbi:PREDICTED: odorant receptor 59b-like [Drosophila arizonae]|uniref:Odorant receptor 59b-like n=1 Tax=Drosophila arizonae TaxID=7263 RepID=A0ABM1Q0G5_DROAR|nr:PREDICTED: odorant receptor 59b-like [Drosophila arizonae]
MLNAGGITMKSLIMCLQLSRLAETMSVLDEMDERLKDDTDRRKIHKAISTCNYVCGLYSVFYVGYNLSMLVTTIFSSQPPWLIYNPFLDWRNGTVQLYLQTLLEFTALNIAVFMNIVLDTSPIICMIAFRAHVEILKDHLRNLRTDPNKTEAENYKELVNGIKYYKLIVKCCDIMRPIMSRTITTQFMLIGAVLGLTMVGVMYSSDIFLKISSIILVIALLLETFPFCFLCDSLVEDSNDLCNILGQSYWIDAERRYKSTLRIFMQQVQQPIIFIGFRTIRISVNSNIKVAKFAFSVLTVVKRMNLFEQFE